MNDKRLTRDEQTILESMRALKIKKNASEPSLDDLGPQMYSWMSKMAEGAQEELERYSYAERLEIYDNTPGKWARREDAALEYWGKARNKLRDIYDLSRLPHSWGMANGLELFGGYDSEDERLHQLLGGAAIWILDQAQVQGKLDALLDILPDHIKFLPRRGDKQRFPILMPVLAHPNYPMTDIWALIRLLANRNAELVAPATFPCTLNDEWTISRNRKSTDSCPQRKAFEDIMGMLDEQAVQLAAQRFESKVWEFYHLAFHADQFVENRMNAYAKEISSLQDRLERAMYRSPAPYASSSSFASRVSFSKASPEQEQLEKLQYQFDAYMAKIGALFTDLTRPGNREQRLRNFKGDMPSELYDALLHFTVDDPYETCFAVLYLLDSGSSLPWLYYGAMAVTYTALDQLPFTYNKSLLTSKPVLSPELLSCLHTMRYPSKGKIPAEEADEFFPARTLGCNLSQLLFDYTNVLWPRYTDPTPVPDNLRAALDQAAAEGLDVYQLLLGRLRIENPLFDDFLFGELFDQELDLEEEENEPEQPDAAEQEQQKLTALCRQYQRDIKALRAEAHQSERALKKLRGEHTQLAAQAERYRLELAELRESVFRAQNGQAQPDELTEEQIAWPCHTQGRIVSFGGHPSWLRAIRPLLPDVRFIPPNQLPDEQLLRNASAIWLQPNCMSHPDFFKIIRIAGSAGKPVHYFTWDSAEKCAQQLVKAENQ